MIKLLSAIYAAYNRSTIGQAWYPDQSGNTFCNFAVNSICNALGYTKFNASSVNTPVAANSMITFLGNSVDWMNIDGNVAQAHANIGALVLAVKSNPAGHGHVCVVIPGEMQYSNNFSKQAPVVMNVGKDVFIGKHSGFAFHEEPSYYVLVNSIHDKVAN